MLPKLPVYTCSCKQQCILVHEHMFVTCTHVYVHVHMCTHVHCMYTVYRAGSKSLHTYPVVSLSLHVYRLGLQVQRAASKPRHDLLHFILSWWGQISQQYLDSGCFELVSSHRQGICIICLAHHPTLYAWSSTLYRDHGMKGLPVEMTWGGVKTRFSLI